MTRLSRAEIVAGKKSGLQLIQQFGAGLEGVDRESAEELGVAVMNIPTVEGNAVSTAEHAMYLLLALLRKPQEMDQVLRARELGSPDLVRRVCLLFGTVRGQRMSSLLLMRLALLQKRRRTLRPQE